MIVNDGRATAIHGHAVAWLFSRISFKSVVRLPVANNIDHRFTRFHLGLPYHSVTFLFDLIKAITYASTISLDLFYFLLEVIHCFCFMVPE